MPKVRVAGFGVSLDGFPGNGGEPIRDVVFDAGNSDLCLTQRRRIVRAVSPHPDRIPIFVECFDKVEFSLPEECSRRPRNSPA
jgi:hypothetical protein